MDLGLKKRVHLTKSMEFFASNKNTHIVIIISNILIKPKNSIKNVSGLPPLEMHNIPGQNMQE